MNGSGVEVIVGCMFSGKTEELIRRIHRAQYAKCRIAAFNHTLDGARYREGALVSHSGVEVPTHAVNNPADIATIARKAGADVVAIDEGQFFHSDVIPVVTELADDGHRVIVAGLNLDYRGEPFGPMPALMARADELTLLTAICTRCGNEATRSQRIIEGESQILVGSKESYTARCRQCHEP